jgi:amino acid transporter
MVGQASFFYGGNFMDEQKKKLGLGSGIAICMGLIVATSCLVSLGQGFGLAGNQFVYALIIVVILNSFVALSFSELNYMMPNVTGGLGQYMLVGLGPWASIVANISAYAITNVFGISVELTMCGIVLNGLFPAIPTVVYTVIVLGILLVLNLFGIDIFAKVQMFMVVILIGSMLVFGVMGVFHLTSAPVVTPEMIDPPITNAIGIVGLSALAFWLFIGVEFVVPVSKDMRNPRRNIPLAMIITLFALLIIQSILGNGMLQYVGTEGLLSEDMPHIAYAERLFGRAGYIWMSVVTLFAAVSTLNTVLPTVGRILQGMADEGMLPKFLRTVNRYNSPWVGMILIVAAVITMVLTGYVNTNGLINMLLAGSCFWIASYIFTHLNVLVLRRRYPNAMRNEKLKLLGIPQIIGMIGCVYMIWNISDDMDARMMIYKVFGILFVILAIFAWMWTRGKMKVDPWKPVYIGTMNIDRSIKIEAKSSL